MKTAHDLIIRDELFSEVAFVRIFIIFRRVKFYAAGAYLSGRAAKIPHRIF